MKLLCHRGVRTSVITHQVSISSTFYDSFYVHRSQKCKKILTTWLFFALLVSACVKAAHRTLMKLTPNIAWEVRGCWGSKICPKPKYLFIGHLEKTLIWVNFITSFKTASKGIIMGRTVDDCRTYSISLNNFVVLDVRSACGNAP